MCNLNCSFCSCSKREKGQQLEISQLVKSVREFAELGTKAVTITGGGEPCCYKNLPDLIQELKELGIQSGMVSNGLLLDSIKHVLPLLTWLRVSVSDDRDIDLLLNVLKRIVPNARIDWAFSYVLTANFNFEKLVKVIEFAQLHNFTHIRLVSDLLDLDNLESMGSIKGHLLERGIDDSLILYQDRSEYVAGSKECKISLLKPVLAPDGWIYPCCGVQYALPQSEGLFPKEMRMCNMDEINQYFSQQEVFDGSICAKCYYTSYNDVLNVLTQSYEHHRFV